MVRGVLVIVLAAACAEHGSRPDAGDPEACLVTLEAELDRTCAASGECTLIGHDDCCGTVQLGVRAATQADALAAEARFEACRMCPPLGCAHPDMAEDGRIPGTGQAIVATCVANRCTSVVQ
jgi:hypothetical protein